MRKTQLFSLLIIAACSFQACQSPEERGSGGDSTAMDSSSTSAGATDSAGGDAGVESGKADTGAVSASTKDSSDTNSGGRNGTHKSKVDGDESDFMKAAALGGMMEVEVGKIAQKSENAKVKAFATQMVADHTKANQELKKLAADKGVLLPAVYPADIQSHIDMMKKMKGSSFDAHYIDMMINDHEKTVALFKTGVRSSTQEVSDFAKKNLPVIEAHTEKAKAIKAGMK